MFEKLKNLWLLNYITIEAMRKWVIVNKLNPKVGITEEEFETITGVPYTE